MVWRWERKKALEAMGHQLGIEQGWFLMHINFYKYVDTILLRVYDSFKCLSQHKG